MLAKKLARDPRHPLRELTPTFFVRLEFSLQTSRPKV